MATALDETLRKRDAALAQFWGPNQLVAGWNSTNELARIVGSFAASTVLLIVDQHVAGDAVIRTAITGLRDKLALVVHEYDGGEPSLEKAGEVSARATGKIDVVIAIGGGSTIDIAKAVALAKATAEPLAKFEGADRIAVTPVPLIAAPTTAGTGSEVTGSCVLTDEAGQRKISIRSPKLMPRMAILDPHFLVSVPRSVIRATGVDALGHALEAYFSAAGNILTDTLALGAISLLTKALPVYYQNPAARSAAEAMAWGSNMAGIAFNSARVGLAHAVASAIGPLTGFSHGLCVGLALPEAIRLNLRARADDSAKLLSHMDIRAHGDDWEAQVCAAVAKLYSAVEFPLTARAAGATFDIDDGLIDRIISSGRLDTNPVIVGKETLREVLNTIRG